MVLHDHLYISPGLQRRSSKIIKKIQNRKKIHKLLCICIAYDPSNLLEIIKLNDLYGRMYEHRSYIIVGIAEDDQQARELVKKIIEDVIEIQNNVDVRRYFDNKNTEEVLP